MSLPARCAQTLRCHQGPVHCLACDVDGEYVLSGGQDRTVCLSKPGDAGRLIAQYRGHAWDVLDVCCSRDRTTLLSAGVDKTLFCWDVLAATPRRKFTGHTARINAIDLSDDASLALTASYDASVRVWDMRGHSNRIPVQILREPTDSVSAVALDSALALCLAASIDGCLYLYDLRKGLLSVLRYALPISACARSDNCTLAFFSSLRAPIRLYDVAHGALLNEYALPPPAVSAPQDAFVSDKLRVGTTLSRSEKWLASGSESGRIYIWDILKGDQPVAVLDGHTQPACAVLSHPLHEDHLFSASADGCIKLWVADQADSDQVQG